MSTGRRFRGLRSLAGLSVPVRHDDQDAVLGQLPGHVVQCGDGVVVGPVDVLEDDKGGSDRPQPLERARDGFAHPRLLVGSADRRRDLSRLARQFWSQRRERGLPGLVEPVGHLSGA